MKIPLWATGAVALLILGLVAALAWQLGEDHGRPTRTESNTLVLPGLDDEPSDKALDSVAKSDVRNAVAQMEACATEHEGSYAECKDAPRRASLPDVLVLVATTNRYSLWETSKSGNSFVISKGADGATRRSCDIRGHAGCSAAGSW